MEKFFRDYQINYNFKKKVKDIIAKIENEKSRKIKPFQKLTRVD